jgi:hypothetical protein
VDRTITVTNQYNKKVIISLQHIVSIEDCVDGSIILHFSNRNSFTIRPPMRKAFLEALGVMLPHLKGVLDDSQNETVEASE